MFKVIFTYDEKTRKWDATVEGATSATEARQGFSAVVLTCQQLNPSLLNHSNVFQKGNSYTIEPAV